MAGRGARGIGFSRGLQLLVALLLVALPLVACGGASSSSSASKTAASSKDHVPTANDVSIGDTALAQGGLDSMGGGTNRAGAAGAAAAGTLRFDRMDRDSPVKMDGSLREWPARTGAKKVVKGDASKTAFAVALEYDDGHIYVGGDVGDSGFVRSSRFADTEDHAVLTLAFPVGSGALAAYDVALFAGEPGETAGVVRFASGARRGRDVPGAKIVEAPAAGGYTFEASIPWSAFPEGRTTRVGLRGSVRYIDSDGPNSVHAVLASGDGDAAHAADLPSILTEPEQAVVEGLLSPKAMLGVSPRFDVVADIAGDAMKERITVYDRFLTVCGPHYRNGTQYFFRDLGAELVSLDARDITGRGKDDLVVQRRFDASGGSRQWFEVWSVVGKTDEPQTIFGHEIAIVSGTKHVDNSVHVAGHDIEVATEPAVGWDVASYAEPYATDVDPLLLPWGAVKSQVFRFDGSRFAKVKEVTQQPAPGAKPPPGAPSSPDTYGSVLAQARAAEPATPEVTKGRDLSKDVFALYRQDHSVAASAKPHVDLQVNVGGDAQPERVVLMGRDIVVLGPGFKGGTGYSVLTLSQFASDDDVKDLSARDVTGDGNADIVVRGVRRVSAAGSHVPDGTSARSAAWSTPVTTESIFIYEVDGDAITRIFAIETGREQQRKRVQGLVQFVPADDHKSFEIDVRPGIVRGWTKRSYPWPQEQPGGQVEPLLLPWGGIDSLRYAWDGAKFSVKN